MIVLALWVAAWRRPRQGRVSCATALRWSRRSSRWGACCRRIRALARPARAARRWTARKVATALLALALVATQLWFPDLYRDYVNERGAAETAYLLGRNALLARGPRRARRAGRPPVSVSQQADRSERNAGATGTA